MEKEIVEKLKSEIQQELDNKIKELDELKQEENDKISSNIQIFLSKYTESKIIDFEILSTFFSNLSFPEMTLDQYKSQIEYLEYCKKYNQTELIEYDVKVINSQINNLIIEINRYQNKLLGNIQKNGYKKRKLKEIIEQCNKFIQIFEIIEKNQLINTEEFAKIVSLLRQENCLIQENDRLQFIQFLTKYNVTYMEESIKREILRVQAEKKKQEANERKRQEKKKNIKVPEKQPETTETPIETSNLNINLTEEENLIFKKAKEIAKITETLDQEIIAVRAIEKDSTWKNRLMIYKTSESIEQQKLIIASDLAKNIIPDLEKSMQYNNLNKELFTLLQKAVKEYEKLEKQQVEDKEKKEKKSKQEYEQLIKNDMLEQLDLCHNVDDLIDKCLQIKESDENLFYAELYGLLQKVIPEKENYINSVANYLEDKSLANKELMDFIYEELRKEYKNLEEQYDEKVNSSSEKEIEYITKGRQFYEGVIPLKNIFAFTNNDGKLASVLEDDVKSDKRLSSKIYESILKCLHANIGVDLITSDNHKAKSDNYEKEFKEKYRVKSLRCGDYRIFYSLFSTNLGEIFNEANPNIIFIHSVGYGATDGNAKGEIHEKALKRCYEDRKNIDYYVELLNTDFKSLSKEETEKKKVEIVEYLNKQYLKLGHLIEKNEQKRGKDGRKRGVGSNE